MSNPSQMDPELRVVSEPIAAQLLARASELDQLHAPGSATSDVTHELGGRAPEGGAASAHAPRDGGAAAAGEGAVGAVRARGVSSVYDATGPVIA